MGTIIYSLDCEFNDSGRSFELISIGLAAEDGRNYYAQDPLFDWNTIDPNKYWLAENVKPNLKKCFIGSANDHIYIALRERSCPNKECPWRTQDQMAQEIAAFTHHATLKPTRKYDPPEFWGFFVSWDWIILLRLYGRVLFDHPPYWPDRANDIAQLAQELGVELKRPSDKYTHNALDDAKWALEEYKKLREILDGLRTRS